MSGTAGVVAVDVDPAAGAGAEELEELEEVDELEPPQPAATRTASSAMPLTAPFRACTVMTYLQVDRSPPTVDIVLADDARDIAAACKPTYRQAGIHGDTLTVSGGRGAAELHELGPRQRARTTSVVTHNWAWPPLIS
jgi:hypothetical protein